MSQLGVSETEQRRLPRPRIAWENVVRALAEIGREIYLPKYGLLVLTPRPVKESGPLAQLVRAFP